jgi:hypothetical protein
MSRLNRTECWLSHSSVARHSRHSCATRRNGQCSKSSWTQCANGRISETSMQVCWSSQADHDVPCGGSDTFPLRRTSRRLIRKGGGPFYDLGTTRPQCPLHATRPPAIRLRAGPPGDMAPGHGINPGRDAVHRRRGTSANDVEQPKLAPEDRLTFQSQPFLQQRRVHRAEVGVEFEIAVV